MRFSASAALFAALTLAACTGPQGNPDGAPYANEAGGTIAVKPETIGKVAYDPYGTPAPFADMQAGQAAINPPPPMTPMAPVPTNPAPARPRR
jgi:hypothetical protein